MVNRTLCNTERELLQSLKKALLEKLNLVEIEIYDLAVQRVLLPLAVYSPQDLLPPDVGELVRDIPHNKPDGKVPIGRSLEISLAMTTIMQHSTNQVVEVIGAAVIYALGQGYGTVSFGTTQQRSEPDKPSGAVVIRIQR